MLGGLFGGGKPKTPNGVKKLSSSITGNIYNVVGAKAIPTMPGAAQKAFKLATDPNAEARDFIEVIGSDESLSARVVKIANSVYFDRGKPSRTIEESVNVIGINELRCLLNATTLSEIFPSRHAARTQLWANDIATAILSRCIAQKLAPARSEVAFLGGLMHDIGKLLLLQRAGDDYQKALRLVEQRGCDFTLAEQEIFSFDHTEVGQMIGESWRFTDELIHIIRDHHQAWPAREKLREREGDLALIVKAADTIAHALALGHPSSFTRVRNANEAQLDDVWELLKIPLPERRDQLQQFKKTFELEYDLYAGKKSG